MGTTRRYMAGQKRGKARWWLPAILTRARRKCFRGTKQVVEMRNLGDSDTVSSTLQPETEQEKENMRIVKEWRRIDNQRGYVNAATGQNVVVVKKPYGEHYIVMLFPFAKKDTEQGKKISPEYATESKAETFALDWMDKHPRGVK